MTLISRSTIPWYTGSLPLIVEFVSWSAAPGAPEAPGLRGAVPHLWQHELFTEPSVEPLIDEEPLKRFRKKNIRQWHLIHIQWELNHNFGRWSYLMAFLDKHGICRRNMSDRLGVLIVLINWSDIRHNWFKNCMMKWHLNLVAQIEVLSLFRLLYSSTSIVQRLEISK